MTELWWLMIGSIRVRLTGADPERTLRMLTRMHRLEGIDRSSDLTVEFTAAQWDWKDIEDTAKRNGDKVVILFRRGLPKLLRSWLEVPVITVTILLLLGASVWLPSRILFIQIEGNETVPARLILEQAEQCGLYFGSSRGNLRSEQIKNRLLEFVPELSWVGVNTSGCVATISLKERQTEPDAEKSVPGNIVAAVDAVITEITATAGTAMCAPGDAVKSGQVLISGYTDLGLCTHVETAEGEVYGLTRRESEAVIPESTLIPGDETVTVKKYSLLFGKKRINLYSDSGILHTGCGKMTQIRYLRLPGGWTLPVALIEETYTVSELRESGRWEQSAREALTAGAQAQIKQAMIAGQILGMESEFDSGDGGYRLKALYECREMIGKRSSGILTEGDAQDDGENGERGAG